MGVEGDEVVRAGGGPVAGRPVRRGDAGDAVVGDGGVVHLGGILGHVAGDAVVGRLTGEAVLLGQGAGRFARGARVASKAFLPVVGHLVGHGFGRAVRIVAGGAAQLAVAGGGLVAAALHHLLDRADELETAVLLPAVDEIHEEILQCQTRPEIELAQPAADHPLLPLDMTLLADGLAQGMIQPFWIDYGVIGLALGWPGTIEANLNMFFAGAMAALAADGQAVEDRLAVAVFGALDMVGPVGVAEEAAGGDRAGKMLVAHLEAGGQVPP